MPLSPYSCANCGAWQRYFTTPPACPICSDVRNDLPEDGWEFLTPAEVGARLTCHRREVMAGLWEYWTTPRYGLDGHGWLLTAPEGNVAFEAAGFYDEAQLAHIAGLGGIAVAAASHPHGYGALHQLQDRFAPELLIQKRDLQWTKAFRVTRPYDEVHEIRPGLTLYRVGGHYEGQAVLHDAGRRALFAGDALKIDFAADGRAERLSCHKAYHKQIPLTPDEARHYRRVFERLEFDTVFTPFDHAPGIDTAAALRLLDEIIAHPDTHPRPIRPGG